MQTLSIYFTYSQTTNNQTQIIKLTEPLNISIQPDTKITKTYIQNQFKSFIQTLSNSHSYKIQNHSQKIEYNLLSATIERR